MAPATASPLSVPVPNRQSAAKANIGAVARRALGYLISLTLSGGCLVAFLTLGEATGWKLPKASALHGEGENKSDDWCKEHDVPLSACVECHPELLTDSYDRALFPGPKPNHWCPKHGVHECPICHPQVAQLPSLPTITDLDRERAARALSFVPRTENDPKCKKHLRHIQIESEELEKRLGLGFAAASRGAVDEVIHSSGEIGYDPTRFARVGPRAAGTVWRIDRVVGEKVRRGDVLAVIDAAEVGRAKAEFQQAVVQRDHRVVTLDKLRPQAGTTIPVRDLYAAEAAVEESNLRVIAAEQALANLGLPLAANDIRGLEPAEIAKRVQFLGFSASQATELAVLTTSSNLLPVIAPFDGEVVARSASKEEMAEPARPLFEVADTSRMRLTLRVRSEDANRVKPGFAVRFRHTGHVGPDRWDRGTVVWVSPAADEKTRTVPVRVDLTNSVDRHRANTFGAAEILMREEKDAIQVPSSAIHWEGCCHVVFVRDRDYESPHAPKVFHVRTVRPGAKVPSASGPMTEIAAGLLPGEIVATTNSGFLRSGLLKNNLGEGCACCAGK